LKGIDIRDHGSGNIGATNILRVCGKPMGITVFIFDVLKGLLPVILSTSLSSTSLIPILAGVAAILGHNFPVWLKFKGGKGIATSAGVLAGLLPWALLVAAAVWVGSFLITRYVSLASILAALSLPVTVGINVLQRGAPLTDPLLLFALVIGLLAVWRHRTNIKRLREGTEHRFTRKRQKEAPPAS
jgi:glycerol-3-phosphate acyltransferase PlsY